MIGSISMIKGGVGNFINYYPQVDVYRSFYVNG